MIMTFLVMSGFGYNTKEKLFYAFAWTPKATVQAALSGELNGQICLMSTRPLCMHACLLCICV